MTRFFLHTWGEARSRHADLSGNKRGAYTTEAMQLLDVTLPAMRVPGLLYIEDMLVAVGPTLLTMLLDLATSNVMI